MTGKQVDVDWIRVVIARLLDDGRNRRGETNG